VNYRNKIAKSVAKIEVLSVMSKKNVKEENVQFEKSVHGSVMV